ncbi:MAG: DUF2267 domain-containing protein [Parachlamydiaceae bacterium]|nr:DUF2267 domain-containing protein [Parachlamydiaceae bacterium]
MTKQGIEVFENTLHKTYEWLNELMTLLSWSDTQRAYLALRSTLQALRDRLPLEIAIKLGAQLPMLIRGFYYEGWKPNETPIKVKGVEEFMEFVTAHAAHSSLSDSLDIEEVVRAVFRVMSHHISPGEIKHIQQALPQGLAVLWNNPESLR